MNGRPGWDWLKVVSYQKTEDKKQSESCDDNLETLIFQDQDQDNAGNEDIFKKKS